MPNAVRLSLLSSLFLSRLRVDRGRYFFFFLFPFPGQRRDGVPQERKGKEIRTLLTHGHNLHVLLLLFSAAVIVRLPQEKRRREKREVTVGRGKENSAVNRPPLNR